jgi:FAD/FMN-containing dehydrogenase/Fe-S oxidoreductase
MGKQIKDNISLTAYESDASIYAIRPKGVVLVNSSEDAVAAVKSSIINKMPVSARGGGTGLSGGAIGNGLILDFSNFKDIIELDKNHKTVTTEVGILFDELNLALKKDGLFFPPDPSSGDSCQIGGMLANNSSGPRSVKYGLTSDFINELEIIKPSGEIAHLKKLSTDSRDLNDFFNEHSEYRTIYEIIRENKELILERWPKVKKNSSGYNLKQVARDLNRGIFNLPALMAGSEGTLGVFLSAKLRLLPIPRNRITARLYFKSLVEAGKAVPDILELGPCGLEIVDGATLNLIGREKYKIPKEAAALLLVEFDDDVESKKEKFENHSRRLNLVSKPDFALDAEAATDLWKARKAITPTLYRHHPTRRPITLIEDVSLPPEHIPSFIEFATGLFDSHNLTYGIFGHIGDGNLHIRPLFDLNNHDELQLARKIYDIVYDKIIDLGGSTTAEHADGRLRAPLVRKLYGDEIYSIFRRIKETLDPDNRFGPGIIISERPFTEYIDYEKLKLFCAACGKCNGYCPAYDIFRREDYSPRGWLRILNQSKASRSELDRYLSFCLNCKNCTIVCPAGVDIAGEIIAHRSRKPSLASSMLVKLTDNAPLLNFMLKLDAVSAPLTKSGVGKNLLALGGKIPFGWDSSFEMPRAAKKSLRKRFSEKIAPSGKVALFHGCADNYFESSFGEAIFAVFDRLGIGLFLPEQKCCGLPQEVYGHRDNLIEKARFNIEHLNQFDTIITGCASCLNRLKEYEKLFAADSPWHLKAEELAKKCHDVSQYLNKIDFDYSIFDSEKKSRVTYHNPCHLRATGLHKEPEKLLAKLKNVEIIHPLYADRCCAQAGSYGYIHYKESKEMFKKKKSDYECVEADYLMTSCPACQMKIRSEMKDKFKVVHPIEILADRLKNKK